LNNGEKRKRSVAHSPAARHGHGQIAAEPEIGTSTSPRQALAHLFYKPNSLVLRLPADNEGLRKLLGKER
jgi:hypothetical protein